MVKFFKKIGSRHPQKRDKPAYISALTKPSTDKISALFIQISSLQETLNQFQLKRRIQQTNHSKVNVMDVLNKELDTANVIEKKYMALKSILSGIKRDNGNIPKESIYGLQQKIIQINKEIETIHERQRYLHLLIAREETSGSAGI